MRSSMEVQWFDRDGKPKTCIQRHTRQLVGLTHVNQLGNDRVALARKLSTGTSLVLVPNPSNPLDRNAILIYRSDDLDDDLGYLDAIGAKQLCKLIERGATFSAEVYWIDNDNSDLPKVYIFICQITEPVHRRRPRRLNAPDYKQPKIQSAVWAESGVRHSYLTRFILKIIGYFR
jgi:hypothetical protein